MARVRSGKSIWCRIYVPFRHAPKTPLCLIANGHFTRIFPNFCNFYCILIMTFIRHDHQTMIKTHRTQLPVGADTS